MRISDIGAWTTCEAMALADPRQEARVHVAPWVGTMAHALLAGDPLPEPPARLRYDTMTSMPFEAQVQAQSIARVAAERLAIDGWVVMATERLLTGDDVTGHLDILAWHSDTQRTAIIDLKTGRDVGAGWLQVGGYLQLMSDEAGMWPAVEWGGILHVPRVRVDVEPKATLEFGAAGELVRAWQAWGGRIRAVQSGATALRSPGQHCGRCSALCPVRI